MTLRVVKIKRTQWVSNLLLKKVVNINNKAHNTVNLSIFMCDCFSFFVVWLFWCFLLCIFFIKWVAPFFVKRTNVNIFLRMVNGMLERIKAIFKLKLNLVYFTFLCYFKAILVHLLLLKLYQILFIPKTIKIIFPVIESDGHVFRIKNKNFLKVNFLNCVLMNNKRPFYVLNESFKMLFKNLSIQLYYPWPIRLLINAHTYTQTHILLPCQTFQ